MNSPAEPHRATLADLLAIPEDQRRHEIIDGVLVEKEAATGRHGAAQGRLFRSLGPFDRRPGGGSPGGWWFATETEVLFADHQILRPDVTGWRRERMAALPAEFPVLLRPDWVCEVLSTNRRRDLIQKKRIFHRYAVPHYWIIDPVDETLTVHRWTADGYVEVLVAECADVVRAEPFDAVELRIGVLFGDDD